MLSAAAGAHVVRRLGRCRQQLLGLPANTISLRGLPANVQDDLFQVPLCHALRFGKQVCTKARKTFSCRCSPQPKWDAKLLHVLGSCRRIPHSRTLASNSNVRTPGDTSVAPPACACHLSALTMKCTVASLCVTTTVFAANGSPTVTVYATQRMQLLTTVVLNGHARSKDFI